MSEQQMLGRAAARGSAISVTAQVVKLIVQTISLIVLARLLPPEVFGLLAIVTALVAFGELFRDFGLTSAAIQARHLSTAQASNLFWANLLIGAILALSMVGAAPALAAIYDSPDLLWIASAMGVTFILVAAQAQFQVALVRTLRFGALAITDIISQVVGVAASIALAAAGFGAWALVAQVLIMQASLLISRAAVSRWWPHLPRRGVRMRGFYKYGVNLFGANVLSYLASNVDTFIIGYRFGAQSLGYYNRAFQLMTLPIRQGLSPLTNVFLPVLSRLQSRNSDFNQMVLRVQFYLCGGAILVFSIAIACANELVPLVLGPAWQPSILLFQILGIGGIFQIFSHLSYWVFLAKGITTELLLYNVVTKLGAIALIVGASFISVTAVAAASSIALILSWPVNLLWLRAKANLPMGAMIRGGTILILAGATCAAVIVGLQTIHGGWWLLLWSGTGAVAYVLVLCIFPSTRRMLCETVRLTEAAVARRKVSA